MRRVLTKMSVVRCCGDERREAVVDLAPLLVRRHGLEIRARHLDREIEVAPVPDVDDGARASLADEKACGLVDRVHRGREADALRPRVGDRVEPRERQGEVAAALVAHQGVHLVDDDRADAAQEQRGCARP